MNLFDFAWRAKRRNLYLLLAICSFCAAVVVANFYHRSGQKQGLVVLRPSLVVNSPAGIREVYGNFEVRNMGNETVALANPILSCGCTSASIEPQSLLPVRRQKSL